MTTDKIIAAAREAGTYADIEYQRRWESGEGGSWSQIRDERFYAIAYRAGMERAAEIAFASDHMHSVNLKLAKNRIGNAIRAEAHAKNQTEGRATNG